MNSTRVFSTTKDGSIRYSDLDVTTITEELNFNETLHAPGLVKKFTYITVSTKLRIAAAAESKKNKIYIYDTSSNKLIKILIAKKITGGDNLVICDDRNIVISGSADNKIYLWKLDSIEYEL